MKASLICAGALVAMLASISASQAQDWSPGANCAVPVGNAFSPGFGYAKRHCGHCCGSCQYGPARFAPVGPVATPPPGFNGAGFGQGQQQYPVHPFARSPRDFFMLDLER
jgi:hypothetical protein